MTRYYGQGCGPQNNCGVYKGAGWVCECDTEGNCSEQPVGEPELWNLFGKLPPEEFAKRMDASTMKFFGKLYKEGNLILDKVGCLADAGLQSGDVLTGVFVVGEDALEMSREEDWLKILTWQFTKPLINVLYERDNLSLSGTMKNPKSS
jgi:hypothetical protein